ncbi:N-acetylmuramoyl-L-alanine amidase [Clostridium baratii]|uniref:N-acetylmuramoyl-L-alanine amidase n=1 Tax=Clostridium baratii TaxID=1561 RepID=UPI0005F2EF6B|nr:N-acetylmuramoyl-L-alanine amidase [Clostridium baratii]AQM59722.1 N-acetylmuramoyl-L-alanine amidase CwlD [Clostridium baratii]KJU71485.1 N-acetylmuramoyl-L-alanine amidase [Clostridium baratii]MBS6041343.1 N-acetylmuramoyl-L-alanine amidase [Clostridium baratii]
MKILKTILLASVFLFLGNYVAYAAENNKEYKVLIDPGHGGYDGGAKSKNGTVEKDINLGISLKLRDVLKEKGYKVYMTREEDIALSNKKVEDLTKRCEMKKENECDIFISIHQNMFQSQSCKGTQVWYASNEKSKALAESIQSSVVQEVQPSNKRVAKDAKKAYKILRDGYDGGCVIIECGFLSNYDDEKKLQNEEYQKSIVTAIGNGIDKYFEGNPEKEPILK